MRMILIAALLAALGMASPALRGQTRPEPPAEWRDHLQAVRAADAIEDHEARCKAYPDLPDNRWRPGAAQARCTLLRAPAYPLEQIAQVLGEPEGAARLERDFSALLRAHYEDPEQREQIFVALDIFDDSQQSAVVSRQWLEAAPDSPFALTAAGSHHARAGWAARGGAYASRTPRENLERMNLLFMEAVPLFARALEIEPTLSVACQRLTAIGAQSWSPLKQQALGHCLSVDPDSYHVVYEQFMRSQPRWGGSEADMRYAIAYAAARVDRNPVLGALLGEAAGYGLEQADDLATVADQLAAVARMGPSGTLLRHTGRGYVRKGDPWRALVYLSQATRFWPQRPAFLQSRATVLLDHLGDAQWARADMMRAVELDPEDGDYRYTLGRVLLQTDGNLAARPHFLFAMGDDRRRRAAHELYCQTFFYIDEEFDQFMRCTHELVTEHPNGEEGWRMRAWALHRAGDAEVITAIDRFMELADPSKPWNASSIEAMRTWRQELRPTASP